MLDVDEPTAWRRAGGKRRPLARDRERFAALHAERAPVYESLADAVLLDGGAETIRRAAGALRRIPPRREGAVGGRGRAQLPGLRRRRARRRVLAACAAGASCSPTRPSARCTATAIPDAAARVRDAGRARRPRRSPTPRRCCAGSPRAGMDHDDHVAALGGGVVGDVAGFCAAVYQRGVGVVQVPTTLVAQVDSAYGGKTGVDLPEGKNYVGAYHQPRAVLADPRTLATLPRGRAGRGLGRGDQDRADRRRAAVGARAPRRRDRRPRPRARLRAHEARASSRATSATPAAARCSTSATPSGTRSRPRPATARYRHGEAVGLGLLAALTLSGQPELRAEVRRAAGRARAADDARRRRRPRGGARRRPARQEAPRRPGRVRPGRGARATCAPARRWPRATSARRWRSCCDEEPRRRPARHQPRRARPAPGRALRRAHVHRSSSSGSARFARELGLAGAASSRPTTRASSSRSCTRRPTTPTA